MLPASMPLNDGWTKQGKQGWASSWTDPPSPRPPPWVFWLVRPHKVSYKVSYKWKLNMFCRVHVDIEFNIDSASRRSSISKVPLRRLFRVICDVCRRRACTVWCSKTRFPLRPAVFSWLAGSLVILMESFKDRQKLWRLCYVGIRRSVWFPAALLRLCVAAWETVTPCISMVRGVYTSRSAATRIAALRNVLLRDVRDLQLSSLVTLAAPRVQLRYT